MTFQRIDLRTTMTRSQMTGDRIDHRRLDLALFSLTAFSM
jgi:hypothetical protein